MSAGLAVTAGVAYWVSTQPQVFKTIVQSPLFLVLALAQLGIVFYLNYALKSMNFVTAATSFLIYSALSGLTFSVFFAVYTMASMYQAFAITAGVFLSMSVYGYVTRTDLSQMGSYLMMGLFGIIISLFVNMWFQSPLVDYYISLIAVGLFTLLTAYDTQKIKAMAEQTLMTDPDSRGKLAVMGALTLYLDFINLFIYLLRLFGKRK